MVLFGCSISNSEPYNHDAYAMYDFLEVMSVEYPDQETYSFEDIKYIDALDVFGKALELNAMYQVNGVHVKRVR